MYDDTGKAIFENEACQVTNGNYEFISDYGVEAFQDRTFTIKVKDMFENETEKTLTISKVDSQAPTLTSERDYNKEWSKNKNVNLEVEDKGIGQVQIAFNDEADYQLAEQKDGKYIRNYNFIGDIYKEMQGVIYLKDGLGNIRTEKINIGKMDGTSPTITNVQTNKSGGNTVITITANDINEKLSQEGSGIAGYAVSRSKEIPRNEAFSQSNTITVTGTGTYYVYVKDNAGNLAQRYEVDVG